MDKTLNPVEIKSDASGLSINRLHHRHDIGIACAACEIIALRTRLSRAERVVKAVRAWDAAEGAMANAYSNRQVTEAKAALLAARLELDLALYDWERENG